MTTMKAETLSEHLFDEARKFSIYPNRRYRSKTNLEAQRLFDSMGQQLITERETFMQGGSLIGHVDAERLPLWFDELYCRSLLPMIPGIVERTLRLREITLAQVPEGPLLTYMKEASRTYAMGFFAASVALSRSAVEAPIEHETATPKQEWSAKQKWREVFGNAFPA